MTFSAKNSLAFVLLAFLSTNANFGQAISPMWPSACPSATPYSDTPGCQARQRCEAPKVICCPASGQCSSSTASSATSTSTAASSTSSPSSTASSTSGSTNAASSSTACGQTSSSTSTASPQSSTSSTASPQSSSSSSSSTGSSSSSSSASQSSDSTTENSSTVSDSSTASASESSSSSTASSSAAANNSSTSASASSSAPTQSTVSSSSSSPCSSESTSASTTANYSVASTVSGASSASVSSFTTVSTTAIGSNEPCPCQLIIALLEFMYAYLNASEQAIFQSDCLALLRIILVDVSLTAEQKVVECGRVIRSFCSAHSSIGDRLKWVQIGDFGYCYDFAFVVAITYEDELADSVCDRIDNTGASNFTVAVYNGTSQNQCGSGSASVWSGFVSDCNQLDARTLPTIDRARYLGYVYNALEYIYFKQYPSQEQCIRNITISTGDYNGTVGGFLDLCNWYNIQTSILTSLLVDNSSTSECPFISSCEQGVSSANSSGQYNSSVVQEANQFVATCKQQFASTSNANSRLQIILSLFVSLSQQCRLLLKGISISGGTAQCSCADVISIGNACQNGFACQNITYGGPGESMDEVCLIDTFNISSLVVASANFLNNVLNTTAQKTGYRTYHNAIVNCCYSSTYGTNVTARIACAKRQVSNYSTNNATLRALYMAVQLSTTIIVKVANSVISAFFGTMGCFCGCTSC